MEKVVVFLDYANINAATGQRNRRVDYGQLLGYLADPEEGRFLQEAFAYLPIDPRREHAMDQRVCELWDAGYLVKSKVGTIAGQSYKCDFDVEMTLDMTRAAFELKPDIVVLASGDGDFVPVALELRSKGIRVEVAAYSESMSSLLRHRCSGFIDLDYAFGDEVSYLQQYEAVPADDGSADYDAAPDADGLDRPGDDWEASNGWPSADSAPGAVLIIGEGNDSQLGSDSLINLPSSN